MAASAIDPVVEFQSLSSASPLDSSVSDPRRESSATASPVVSNVSESSRSPRLLFLDDDPGRARIFLDKNPAAVWVRTVEECVDQLVATWDEVHLDHDLGGKQFVDVNEVDCGMEVIRWLCKEPRAHLRPARFFIHTHNTFAGLLMVLQMREHGYYAEFRPFGFDLGGLFANEPPYHLREEKSAAKTRSAWKRWWDRLRDVLPILRTRIKRTRDSAE